MICKKKKKAIEKHSVIQYHFHPYNKTNNTVNNGEEMV